MSDPYIGVIGTLAGVIIGFIGSYFASSIDTFNEASHEYTDYYKRVEVCAMPKPGIETEDIHIKTSFFYFSALNN